MKTQIHSDSTLSFSRRWLLALAVFTPLALLPLQPALAGGKVMPPNAKPKGYSLADAAAATALFNVGPRTPESLPDVPFQILYTRTFTPPPFIVRPGTWLYVPVFSSDDRPVIVGDFPDVNDPAAVAEYYFSPEQLGAEYIEIVVDGEVNTLGPEYIAGVEVALPGGTAYTVAAAFINPLNKGTHTVEIRARFSGAAVLADNDGEVLEYSIVYTVIVR
ncbi:MAG: hypothetical protein M3463_22805 [Verrucomicrobiota bacterium]|nr:hypothetical protein [Verrucomicrobiota bacterium]